MYDTQIWGSCCRGQESNKGNTIKEFYSKEQEKQVRKPVE